MSTPEFVQKVVKKCLNITKEDKVAIFAWRHMLDLAEAFAIECRRTGAQVHTEFGSDELFYDEALNLPQSYLEETDPFDFALSGLLTASINISGPENPERMKSVPPERWMAMSRGDKQIYERLLQRRVRAAEIQLGHVTQSRAGTYGLDYDTWLENVKDSINVPYEDMQALGKKLAHILESSREVQITDANGTNVNLTLTGRQAHVDDGVIDEEDIKSGALYSSLPSGSVSVAPDEVTATGTVKAGTPFPQVGVLINDITIKFEDGIITSFEGGKNIDVLRRMWKGATGDKDRIGWLTLGINPKAKLGFLHDTIVLGTATVGAGYNKELGGNNEGDWALPITTVRPTVKIDGKSIIKNGELSL